jgi:hypothetical protein
LALGRCSPIRQIKIRPLGAAALFYNSPGSENTAGGAFALFFNTTVASIRATGTNALFSNTTRSNNTANGVNALHSNTAGKNTTANGDSALFSNKTGFDNNATGVNALASNTTGFDNSATGVGAFSNNTNGFKNVAYGDDALENNTSGSRNTALGNNAERNLTTGSNNIDIGDGVEGVAGESNKIRIGVAGTQDATFIAGITGVSVTGSQVMVSADGQLGISGSSARFKQAIKPMEKTSEGVLELKPVTFRYKKEIDPEGRPQFGLVAEDVEKVNPDLVVRDKEGKTHSVR